LLAGMILGASATYLIAAEGIPAKTLTITAIASSFQPGNEPGFALDGSGASLWHSKWGEPRATLPQWILLDQGEVASVASLLYQPRPDGGNGTVTKYNLAVSNDGKEFTMVVKDGQWAANAKRKVVSFDAVKTRYVRLEVLEGVGGFASAAELMVAPTPIDPMVERNTVTVSSPAYGGDIQGDTPIAIAAAGFTSVTVSCWKQGADDKSHGSEATVGTVALDAAGKGSIVFPANDFPHGPLCVRIAAAHGSIRDTCWLQLYNKGGSPWRQGMPKDAPPAATGMTLLFADDFERMPTISDKDSTATYYSHKPPDGGQDFSSLRFTDLSQPGNPFTQMDTWLRIRADENKHSAGLISSLKKDGSGVVASLPCYFECRFLGVNATGAWPAFWLLSKQPDYPSQRKPCDELDIIEAYGGEGPGRPNAMDKYCITFHAWNQGNAGKKLEDDVIKQMGGIVASMNQIGIPSTWFQTPHTYGCKVTDTDTIYYCDDLEIRRHKTMPTSKQDPFYFLINLATGGGWPVDLSRYHGIADMYVDYVRVYGANVVDVDKAKQAK
ncbi:MAG TPA: discoidin domain-containing protein, partial [Planctomycetota bacterium]|nr:discoidin domain-containing protein [Planctomycetota bacterium]